MSPALIGMVIQAEDRRFDRHAGVDWWALGGALVDYLSGATARGASTLSMQMAAMLDPDLTPKSNRRSIAQKLMQLRAALRLEARWTKDQILEAYLNLTSFYGELQGIGAAARELFGKRPSGLSAAESRGARGPAPLAQPPRLAARQACLCDCRCRYTAVPGAHAPGGRLVRHSAPFSLACDLAPPRRMRGCGIRENGCKRPSSGACNNWRSERSSSSSPGCAPITSVTVRR